MAMLHNKLDRMWLQVEFVRSHMSSYLGDEIALTYLADETPIFVNANDFGGPMNYLNGGQQ